MTLTQDKINLYRSPKDVDVLFQIIIDSYLSTFSGSINEGELRILEKLKELDINLNSQLMHIFEAPLDRLDFKDLIHQVIKPVIYELLEKASACGVISEEEKAQINFIINK